MKTLEKEDNIQTIPILYAMLTGYGFGRVVARKGPADPAVVGCVLERMQEAGLTGPLRLRTDQEPSAKKVAQAIADARGASTIVEVSPRKSSSSMGGVERWARTLSGLTRTLALQLEDRWHVKVLGAAPVFPWAVRHAMWLQNRFGVRASGLTPYEHVRDKPYVSSCGAAIRRASHASTTRMRTPTRST